MALFGQISWRVLLGGRRIVGPTHLELRVAGPLAASSVETLDDVGVGGVLQKPSPIAAANLAASGPNAETIARQGRGRVEEAGVVDLVELAAVLDGLTGPQGAEDLDASASMSRRTGLSTSKTVVVMEE